MDERYNYKLSEIVDERWQGSPNMKELSGDLDSMDLKLLNVTDLCSASVGNIDDWETEFMLMETQNESGDNTSFNGYKFGFESNGCGDFEKPTAIAEGRFPENTSPIFSDLEEKSFDFAFRNCHDGYLAESLKDCAQSLLNILEKITKSEHDGEKLENATPEELKMKMLERRVRDLQDKNIRLTFMRDLLLEELAKPKIDAKLKVLQDKFRYANSLAKLASEKKNTLEEELKRLRRHAQFIQIRLCTTEEENYRLKKENGQFKMMIQNILNDKTCKYAREDYFGDSKSWQNFVPNHCDRCTLLCSLKDKGFSFKSDGSLTKTKIEATSSNGTNGQDSSFSLIDDDDLEVDGGAAPKGEE